MSKKQTSLGIVFRPENSPEKLPDYARRAEEAGFRELWLWEDCFYAGGIAAASAALAATDHIHVGLGIMPAVVRSPVFAAMEIAALARLYPGRFLPGLGHGVRGWMEQIGVLPQSQLIALEEVTVSVRALLAGERFTFNGYQLQLDDVALHHPPAAVPPLYLGVRGPKSLALSGRVSDGVILAEYAAPAYVAWAREQIAAGAREAGLERRPRLVVYALCCVAETAAAAHARLRPLVAAALLSGSIAAQVAPLGILPQVEELKNAGDEVHFAAEMPAAWIDELALAGTPADWARGIARLIAAGADSVVLVPMPGQEAPEWDLFAHPDLAAPW